jgi:hypothetical protein
VLLCQSYIAFSETIVVTSNADDGVGTLRAATCDGNKGKIEGAFTVNVDKIEWLNEAGEVVGTTLDLENQPSVCIKTSEELIIELARSTRNYSTTKIITAATCGLDNGKIEAIFTHEQPPSCFWKNNTGIKVGNSRILENQGP